MPLPSFSISVTQTSEGAIGASPFNVRHTYTRDQVAELIQMPMERRGGNWRTGYDRWNGDFYVFCNVGGAGRTGHNYPNSWHGPLLNWSAKNGSRLEQPQIQELLSGNYRVHMFWRAEDRAPFTYAGEAKVHDVQDTSPVQVTWHFEQDTDDNPPVASTSIVREPPSPVFRRGPTTNVGERTSIINDRPTFVYIMRLTGPISAIFPNLHDEHWIIKVGKSWNVERRRRELNGGFPNGCAISWEIIDTRLYDSDADAFAAEGRLLEVLRHKGQWLNGEFAMVPMADLPIL